MTLVISVLEMPGIPVTGTPSIYLMFGFIHNRHSITSKRDGKLKIKAIDGLPVTGTRYMWHLDMHLQDCI